MRLQPEDSREAEGKEVPEVVVDQPRVLLQDPHQGHDLAHRTWEVTDRLLDQTPIAPR